LVWPGGSYLFVVKPGVTTNDWRWIVAFYAVDGRTVSSVAEKTFVVLRTAASKRAKVVALEMGGSDGTPADVNLDVQLRRATVSFGTPVAGSVPQALDPGEPAATVTRDDSGGTEPTYTANAEMYRSALNGRATIRWVPPVPGLAIVIPISGFLGMPTSLSVMNASWSMMFEE
jgi:hypothetical protein